MNEPTHDLCCCEYYDENNERSHIFLCCCNCVDVDDAVESLISSHRLSEHSRKNIMSTVQDRLRIPWKGGAIQVGFDSLLPVIILPTMFLLASVSLWWTIFAFTTVTIFLAVIFNFLIKTIPRTKFFLMWTFTSIILLYVVFEFVVIPFLEILLEENIALSILICGFVLCFYYMRVRTKQLTRLNDGEAEFGGTGRNVNRFCHCHICDMRIPDKDHHCLWFDTCVGKHNQCLFMLALFFAIAALLYSSNLTLTSVCHPFLFYKTILLPDDCSDVYQQFELGLSFVSAVYSIFVAVLLFFLLVQQVLLVSIGISLKEWRKLSFCSKLCLGLTTSRPYSRGFFRNWTRTICWSANPYFLLNQS